MVNIVLVGAGDIPLTFPQEPLHKSHGFVYLPLTAKVPKGNWTLELFYNGTQLANRTNFSVVALPTPVPVNATPVPLFGGIVAVDQIRVELGLNNSQATVTLFNNSNAPIAFTAKTSVIWLAVEPTSGRIPANGSIPLLVKANRDGLPSAAYYGSVIVTATIGSGTSTTTISVILGA